jgi:hypothetical protein
MMWAPGERDDGINRGTWIKSWDGSVMVERWITVYKHLRLRVTLRVS